VEEERRLAYVALSRAKRVLYISFVDYNESGKPLVSGECEDVVDNDDDVFVVALKDSQ